MVRHTLLMCVLLPAPALFGAACLPGALSSYVALGSGGCDESLFTFKNFVFTPAVMSGTPTLLTPADISVTPVVNGSAFGLNFAGAFSVTGLDAVTYEIDYTTDPPPPILHGFSLDMFANSPVAPGTADITATLCANGLFSGAVCNTPGTLTSVTVFHHGVLGTQLTNSTSFADTNLVDVHMVITLAGNGASSSFTSVSAIYNAPEPGTFFMAGAALAALWLRRRQR